MCVNFICACVWISLPVCECAMGCRWAWLSVWMTVWVCRLMQGADWFQHPGLYFKRPASLSTCGLSSLCFDRDCQPKCFCVKCLLNKSSNSLQSWKRELSFSCCARVSPWRCRNSIYYFDFDVQCTRFIYLNGYLLLWLRWCVPQFLIKEEGGVISVTLVWVYTLFYFRKIPHIDLSTISFMHKLTMFTFLYWNCFSQ